MRGTVSVSGLSKTYGDVVALRDVSLEVKAGEFLTLLGPSGCGKTTLLRLLAGFEAPDAGRILISGNDVAELPPYRRPVNTVFQAYALFPHRTVSGNVAFGLEDKGLTKAMIGERVEKALDMVRLPGYGERRIHQLSGGQKQRVALARAVVLEPEVLLLDEPMSALDLKLRKEMQVEVKNLQERLKITFVFVTHDQDEALVMSDRIAVMNQGRIEQLDAPEALYERPRTRFVADFLAVRNILEATVLRVVEGHAELSLLGPEGAPSPTNTFKGRLDDEIYLGDWTDWRVRLGDEVISVAEGASLARTRKRGDEVTVKVPPEAVLRLENPEAPRT